MATKISPSTNNAFDWHDQYSLIFDQYLDIAFLENASSNALADGLSAENPQVELPNSSASQWPGPDMYLTETGSPLSSPLTSVICDRSSTTPHARPKHQPHASPRQHPIRNHGPAPEVVVSGGIVGIFEENTSGVASQHSHLHSDRDDFSTERPEDDIENTVMRIQPRPTSPIPFENVSRSTEHALYPGNMRLARPRNVSDAVDSLHKGFSRHEGLCQPMNSKGLCPHHDTGRCSANITLDGRGSSHATHSSCYRNMSQHRWPAFSPVGTEQWTLMKSDARTDTSMLSTAGDSPAVPVNLSSRLLRDHESSPLSISYAPNTNLSARFHGSTSSVNVSMEAEASNKFACAVNHRSSMRCYNEDAPSAAIYWGQHAALESQQTLCAQSNSDLYKVLGEQGLCENSESTQLPGAKHRMLDHVSKTRRRSRTASPASYSRKESSGRRVASIGFVNFTPTDSERILSGVAPSGSSKTKARREKEAAERRRRLGEVAVKLVQEAGGDSCSLEREGLLI